MMLYEQVTDVPRLASMDYQTRFSQPVIPDERNDWDGKIFRGTGVPIKDHPQNGSINMYGCGNCKSDNVAIIYTQWSVSVASGDVYWDYELVCKDCSKFTSKSFSDN
jgi:hypothetical protein